MNNDREVMKALKELSTIRVKQTALRALDRNDEASELEFDAAEIEGNIVESFRELRKQAKQTGFYQSVSQALGSA
jgi:hypothetical protein